MAKYAFLSDIHGNIIALEAVLNDIKKQGIPVEYIYCLGDLVGYGPNPNEVIELIRDMKIPCVLGNYDEAVGFYLPNCGCKIDQPRDKEWMLNSLGVSSKLTSEENKAFLRELEDKIEVILEGKKILMVHGSPYSIVEYVFEDSIETQSNMVQETDAEVIVFGHTHYPYVKAVNEVLLINTGSVGRPKDRDPRAAYVVLEIGEAVHAVIHRVAYDVREVEERIRKSELLVDFAKVLQCGCTDESCWK